MFHRVLLVLILAAVIALSYYAIRNPSVGRRGTVPLPTPQAADAVAGIALRLGRPLLVSGSTTRIVPVHLGPNHDVIPYSSPYAGPPIVNVLLLAEENASLLLDRPGRIVEINLPDTVATPGRQWILYDLTFEDTDGDGRLSERDGRVLGVSHAAAGAMKLVLSAGLYLDRFFVLDRDRVLVYAFNEPPPRRGQSDVRRQLTFTYVPSTGALEPLDAADQLLNRAAELLTR